MQGLYSKTPVIATESMVRKMKLVIRKMKIEDAGPLFELMSNPEVMKYMEPPYDYDKTVEFLEEYGIKEPPYVFTVTDEDKFVGYAIFHEYEEDSMEIGWVLSPSVWGRGYATELTHMMMEQAKGQTQKLIIECDPEQKASQRIAEKCGFTFIGEEDDLYVYQYTLQ